MKFKKEFLRDLLWDDIEDTDNVAVIEDEIIDTTRWSTVHYLVFKYYGTFYGTHYTVGATDQHGERPFEYSPNEVECEELVPVEIKKIKYMTLKEAEKY